MRREPEAEPRRILVRGVNWLGDAVMTTPALLRLRERFPAAHIALLTPSKIQDLWKLHDPTINETIAFAPGETILSIRKKLKAREFDLALVLPNSPRSALEVWFAGIPSASATLDHCGIYSSRTRCRLIPVASGCKNVPCPKFKRSSPQA